jgi:uncharacterized protein (TIGR00251 family)
MNALTPGTHRLGVRIEIRVSPRASRSGIDGVRDGRLVVRVTAPPVDHAANDAVVEVLAEAFHLPKRAFTIVAGARSRSKSITVAGMTEAAILSRLSAILGQPQ